MPMRSFELLLGHVDPGFICYACGDASRKEAFLASIEHRSNSAPAPSVLKKVPAVPGASEANRFYERHNGALLYTLRGSTTGGGRPNGIELFPIGEWRKRTAQTVESWQDGEYDDTKMPYGRD